MTTARTRRAPIRLAAAALALALGASACGSSKSSRDTTATTGTGTTAAGGSSGAFAVDASKCPPEAKTALAAGAPIKLGTSLPQTGALAAFGALSPGMKVYFDKVGAEKGGVDGHKIEVVTKDDGYEPARTVANVTELLQQEKIFASVLQVGTPNVRGTRAAFEASCTPQLWVGTGFPEWGDAKNHQWTTGGIAAYNTEAKVWAQYIKDKKPGARVSQLTFNNDFGKSYVKAFEKEAKTAGLTIGVSKLHEAAAPSIDNEVAAMLADKPDVVLGETTGTFCPKLFGALAKSGFKGITIISATCASVSSFFKPAGAAADGVLVIGAQKDPSDPQYASDPAVTTYKADVAKYGAGANANDGSVLTGYNIGALVVHNLEQAAKASGGLTRVNLMNAVWNTSGFKLPLSLGGSVTVDGNKDAYAAETFELLRYDAAKGSQVLTGDKIDLEGKTGLFEA